MGLTKALKLRSVTEKISSSISQRIGTLIVWKIGISEIFVENLRDSTVIIRYNNCFIMKFYTLFSLYSNLLATFDDGNEDCEIWLDDILAMLFSAFMHYRMSMTCSRDIDESCLTLRISYTQSTNWVCSKKNEKFDGRGWIKIIKFISEKSNG